MAVTDHVDLATFMAGVTKRNPGQTEFIQAVQEVAQDIFEFMGTSGAKRGAGRIVIGFLFLLLLTCSASTRDVRDGGDVVAVDTTVRRHLGRDDSDLPELDGQVECGGALAIEETVDSEFISNLEFLKSFDRARAGVREVVDGLGQKEELLIKLCYQNNGRLGTKKREKHFPMLTDEEVAEIEGVIREASLKEP